MTKAGAVADRSRILPLPTVFTPIPSALKIRPDTTPEIGEDVPTVPLGEANPGDVFNETDAL